MTDTPASRAMQIIEACAAPKSLRQMAINARQKGEADVARAAELRLYAVLPAAAPGTFAPGVWQSIHALEGALSAERSKTTRLVRTRQKIARVGEFQTIKDLIMGKPSGGFSMLIERSMDGLTFEAVALRHPGRFDDTVLLAASERLRSVGVDVHQNA